MAAHDHSSHNQPCHRTSQSHSHSDVPVHDHEDHSHHHSKDSGPSSRNGVIDPRTQPLLGKIPQTHYHSFSDGESQEIVPAKWTQLSNGHSTRSTHNHHHHHHHIDMHLEGSFVATGVLMLALSIHSMLAGVSIGLETNVSELTGTAIAILSHKAFEAFSLGASLVQSLPSTGSCEAKQWSSFWKMGALFSFATPTGIGIGYILLHSFAPSHSGSSSSSPPMFTVEGSIPIAVVQAMVAGTFLYISIMEIGTKELLSCCAHEPVSNVHKAHERNKLFSFIVGYLAMSSLALYV